MLTFIEFAVRFQNSGGKSLSYNNFITSSAKFQLMIHSVCRVECLAAAFNKKRRREERTPLISQHKIWKWHYKSKKHQDPEMF